MKNRKKSQKDCFMAKASLLVDIEITMLAPITTNYLYSKPQKKMRVEQKFNERRIRIYMQYFVNILNHNNIVYSNEA